MKTRRIKGILKTKKKKADKYKNIRKKIRYARDNKKWKSQVYSDQIKREPEAIACTLHALVRYIQRCIGFNCDYNHEADFLRIYRERESLSEDDIKGIQKSLEDSLSVIASSTLSGVIDREVDGRSVRMLIKKNKIVSVLRGDTDGYFNLNGIRID